MNVMSTESAAKPTETALVNMAGDAAVAVQGHSANGFRLRLDRDAGHRSD
jgi:hypothetical protein